MERKTKVIYVAEDGTEFEREKACVTYEWHLEEANALERRLYSRPEGSSNTDQPIVLQVWADVAVIRSTVAEILVDIARYHNYSLSEPLTQNIFQEPEVMVSWLFYQLGEYPYAKAYNYLVYRLSCIDNKGWEWGQPYFARMADEAAKTEKEAYEEKQ